MIWHTRDLLVVRSPGVFSTLQIYQSKSDEFGQFDMNVRLTAVSSQHFRDKISFSRGRSRGGENNREGNAVALLLFRNLFIGFRFVRSCRWL